MAQLIQGTDIQLYTGTIPETVSNVLIGEPSADGKSFTLAIPKGDAHSWEDRKIGFFGRIFRSIGFPAQGIEANIPLSWHKKVSVQFAYITGAITVFEKGTYTKHVFTDAYFRDNRGAKVSRNGAQPADDVTATVYSFAHDNSYTPKIGDIIVNGESAFTFTTTSEQTISESMASFRTTHGDPIIINRVDVRMNGAKPDFEIFGR